MADDEEGAGASNTTNTPGLDSSENMDFSAQDFDPLSALYSPDFLVSDVNVQTYESVQHFLSTHLAKVRSERASGTGKPAASQDTEGINTECAESDLHDKVNRTTMRPEALKPVAEACEAASKEKTPHSSDVAMTDAADSTPSPAEGGATPTPVRKKKQRRTVITQMRDAFNKGPLNLLKRSVDEKLKVQVWTRSVRNIRGIITGYVVAFDKHMNLALIDVDEVYRKPPGKHQKASRKRVNNEANEAEESATAPEPVLYPTAQWQPVDKAVASDVSLQHVGSLAGDVDSKRPPALFTEYSGHDSGWQFTHAGRDTMEDITSAFSGMHVFSESAVSRLLGVKTRRLLSRHMNQVLLRGDHVVAVALADQS